MELTASLPPRERGLKLPISSGMIKALLSLPPRERGLKRIQKYTEGYQRIVAPPAGAWIETLIIACGDLKPACRSPRGSVD